MDTTVDAQLEPKLMASVKQPIIAGVFSKYYGDVAHYCKPFASIHVKPVDLLSWKPLDEYSVPHILIVDLTAELFHFLSHYENHSHRHRWIVLALFIPGSSVEWLSRCFEKGLDDCLQWPSLAIIFQNRIVSLVERLTQRIHFNAERRWLGRQLGDVNSHPFSRRWLHPLNGEEPRDKASIVDVHVSDSPHSQGDFAVVVPRFGRGYVLAVAEISGVGHSSSLCAIPMTETVEAMVHKGCELSDIARQMNTKLRRYLTEGQFCRCALVEIVLAERLFKVWSGGFKLLYFINDQGRISSIASSHVPLGVLPDAAFDDTLQYLPMDVGSQLFAVSLNHASGRVESLLNAENFAGVLLKAVTESKACGVDNGFSAPDTHVVEHFENSYFQNAQQVTAGDSLCSARFMTVVEALERGVRESAGLSPSRSAPHSEPDFLSSLIRVRMLASHHVLIDSKGGEAMGLSSIIGSTLNPDGPSDWALSIKLNPQSLRQFDPLPLLLQLVREVPGLSKIHSGVYTVLSELYTNALEHGVLQLSSQLKKDARGFSEYYRLRKDRLATLQEGYVQINVRHEKKGRQHKLEIRVKDSGDGFDHTKWRSNASLVGYAGRGIELLKNLCKSVSWQGKGNSVRAVMTCIED